MSKEFLAKAFLPFEQESDNSKSKYLETGLGLSIVKNIVKLMGGTITIKSEQGVGTEVTLEIEKNNY